MAYLKLIFNQKDDLSFDRIINVPRRKLGKKTTDIISEYAAKKTISKFEACYEIGEMGLSNSAVNSIESFVSMIEMFMIKKDIMPLSEFILELMEVTGLKDMLLQDETVEGRSRVENIDEFLSAAKDFEDGTVFITGLEEGLFPSIHDDDKEEDIEEERRLFYVAITRAKKMLYITYANERMRFGSHEYKIKSRFLKEIPEECIEESNQKSYGYKKLHKLESNILNIKRNSFSDSGRKSEENENKPKLKSDNIAPGDKIMHKAWGIGTVVQLKDEGEDKIIVVAFEDKGIKNLSLKHAPIEKI